MIPLRVVVVGGGVIGLLTAVECVRAGAEVDLVDQDTIPSPRATSNDLHRVVRALHRGDATLTRAGARAHEGWLEVQRLLGARFYHQTGVLTVMEAGDVPVNLDLLAVAGAGNLANGAANLANGAGAGSTAAQVVPARELAARFPQLRLPGGLAAIFEPYAGAVLAGQALAAMARWLGGQPGVTLRPGRRVTAVDTDGTVRLEGHGGLGGDRVVVAAGPWSRELLPATVAADVKLYRQTMLSYAPPSWWAATPAVLGLGPGHDAWMMPPVAGTPARLSAASACRVVATMSGRETPGSWRQHLTGRFAGLLAGFDPAAVTGAADGYYLAAADGGPLLAALPDGVVWMYGACGGMSFKFAPLVARALADRALGRPPRPAGLDSIDRPQQHTELSSAERHPTRSGAGLPGAERNPARNSPELSGAERHPTRSGGPRREETP